MYKISELFTKNSERKPPFFSFEFFPPKNEEGEQRLYNTIGELKELKPDFVSVTYGAGGSTREKTLEWVSEIQERYGITAMAHFTCVGASRDEIKQQLITLNEHGIRNIMALRGDPPRGEEKFVAPADGFPYASDLIAFIRQLDLDFSIGAAAYPEIHQEASSADDDLKNLKTKVNAGADFLVTQLFFDNEIYFRFVERCKQVGIHIPIIPGIMPITQMNQIEKFTRMAGTVIPESLVKELTECGEDTEKLRQISLEYTTRQVLELLKSGAPGIHFYTLNQSQATMKILKRVRSAIV